MLAYVEFLLIGGLLFIASFLPPANAAEFHRYNPPLLSPAYYMLQQPAGAARQRYSALRQSSLASSSSSAAAAFPQSSLPSFYTHPLHYHQWSSERYRKVLQSQASFSKFACQCFCRRTAYSVDRTTNAAYPTQSEFGYGVAPIPMDDPHRITELMSEFKKKQLFFDEDKVLHEFVVGVIAKFPPIFNRTVSGVSVGHSYNDSATAEEADGGFLPPPAAPPPLFILNKDNSEGKIHIFHFRKEIRDKEARFRKAHAVCQTECTKPATLSYDFSAIQDHYEFAYFKYREEPDTLNKYISSERIPWGDPSTWSSICQAGGGPYQQQQQNLMSSNSRWSADLAQQHRNLINAMTCGQGYHDFHSCEELRIELALKSRAGGKQTNWSELAPIRKEIGQRNKRPFNCESSLKPPEARPVPTEIVEEQIIGKEQLLRQQQQLQHIQLLQLQRKYGVMQMTSASPYMSNAFPRTFSKQKRLDMKAGEVFYSFLEKSALKPVEWPLAKPKIFALSITPFYKFYARVRIANVTVPEVISLYTGAPSITRPGLTNFLNLYMDSAESHRFTHSFNSIIVNKWVLPLLTDYSKGSLSGRVYKVMRAADVRAATSSVAAFATMAAESEGIQTEPDSFAAAETDDESAFEDRDEEERKPAAPSIAAAVDATAAAAAAVAAMKQPSSAVWGKSISTSTAIDYLDVAFIGRLYFGCWSAKPQESNRLKTYNSLPFLVKPRVYRLFRVDSSVVHVHAQPATAASVVHVFGSMSSGLSKLTTGVHLEFLESMYRSSPCHYRLITDVLLRGFTGPTGLKAKNVCLLTDQDPIREIVLNMGGEAPREITVHLSESQSAAAAAAGQSVKISLAGSEMRRKTVEALAKCYGVTLPSATVVYEKGSSKRTCICQFHNNKFGLTGKTASDVC